VGGPPAWLATPNHVSGLSSNIPYNYLAANLIRQGVVDVTGCSDGGLLNAPVSVNRYVLHAGERIEILVDFSGQNGQSFDLKAFNSTLSGFIAGGENFTNGPFGNYLGHKDFTMLHVNVAAPTANPITAIPTALTTNVLLNAADANITRILTLSDSTGVTNPPILGPNAFIINHKLFDINFDQYKVPLGNTEIWEIRSTSGFGHPFHIHDVEFNILSINGAAPPAAQAGWKDVVFIPRQQTVRFIARFEDFADTEHPFMYHCHISLHEDEGMMGQFVVTDPASGTLESIKEPSDVILYPNPATDRLMVSFSDPDMQAYYVRITNVLGKTNIGLLFHQFEVNEKQIDDRLSQLAEYEINNQAIMHLPSNK